MTFFVLFVPAARWRRVMAVCLIAILFPNIAGDYKLLMLLPGLLDLISYEEHGKRETICLILLALLMVPKQYYFIDNVTTISVIISPLLLIGVVGCTVGDRRGWLSAVRGLCEKGICNIKKIINLADTIVHKNGQPS
jgi:hypothetical protein